MTFHHISFLLTAKAQLSCRCAAVKFGHISVGGLEVGVQRANERLGEVTLDGLQVQYP